MKNHKFYSSLLNKLIGLTLCFYASMFFASYLGMNESLIEALKSGGTLSLGALIGIAKDTTEDNNDDSPPPLL